MKRLFLLTWSFAVLGLQEGSALTPAPAQFTFANRGQCERAMHDVEARGFVVLGALSPSAPHETIVTCWSSGRIETSPMPSVPVE